MVWNLVKVLALAMWRQKKSHTCNYLVVKSWESMRDEFHRISNFMETFGTVQIHMSHIKIENSMFVYFFITINVKFYNFFKFIF